MDTIVGLGKTGCGIADELTAYPEYRIYKIGPENPNRGDFDVEPQPDIEAYESSMDTAEMSSYLRNIKKSDEVLFIVGGGEPISGMSLKILEQINHAKIHVLYVAPDRQVSTHIQCRDDRIVGSVLQEYARSGMLERIYLVSRPEVEQLVGDVSITQYEKTINHFISYVVAMINYYNHTEALLNNRSPMSELSRIATFGVSSLDEGASVSYLYRLAGWEHAHYYYGIPAEELEQNNQLLRQIKEQTKSLTQEGVDTSFSVYSTTFEQIMVLALFHTKDPQLIN